MELDACVSNDHRHLELHLTIRLGVLPLSLLLKWEFSRLYYSQQGDLILGTCSHLKCLPGPN